MLRTNRLAIGAHVADRNSGAIGICLIGGHGSSERDRFADHLMEAESRRSANSSPRSAAGPPSTSSPAATVGRRGLPEVPRAVSAGQCGKDLTRGHVPHRPCVHLIQLAATLPPSSSDASRPQARARWGIEIEARHREALHSALMTGVRHALARGAAGARGGGGSRGGLRSDQRTRCAEGSQAGTEPRTIRPITRGRARARHGVLLEEKLQASASSSSSKRQT